MTTDVIQHQSSTEGSDGQEPELIRDKNVKIIKQTKNERLSQFATIEDSEEDSDEFERMSIDEDIDVRGKLQPDIDMDGNLWTHLSPMNEDWHQLKKFERWLVIDGVRPQHEFQQRDNPHVMQHKIHVSTRMNHVMNRILENLTKLKKGKAKPRRTSLHKNKVRYISVSNSIISDGF